MAEKNYTKTVEVQGEAWKVELCELEGFDTLISASAGSMRFITEVEIPDSEDDTIRAAIVAGFYDYDPTP
jgi:hypothetical protein